MKKAKFTEATQQLESVKTQVALCIQENGVEYVTKCTNSGGEASGFGWELKTNSDYATKYVAVTTEATNYFKGEDLTVDGYWTKAGQLDWKVNSNSGCITAKLCAKGDK